MRNFSAELDSLLFDAAEAAGTQPDEPEPSVESLASQLGIPLPELNRRVHAEKLRRSFADFFRESWPVLEQSTPLSWSWHIEVVCGHIQRLIEDHVKKKADPLHVMEYSNSVINVPPGTAKPCHEEGFVVEKRRGLIRLKEVRVGDRVKTHKGRFREVVAVHEQGELPLYTITTKRGRKIKVAGDHPMLTARGWIEAQHLADDDVLAEIHGKTSCGSNTISAEEARLIGYLIGDGCLSQASAATFTNQDPETLEDFIACASSLSFEASVRKRPPSYPNSQNKYGLPSQIVTLKDPSRQRGTRGDVGPVRRWVRERELESTTSYTKKVPRVVLEGSDEIVAEYLAAYWACDGTIEDRRDLPRPSRKNQKLKTVRVSATTVSEQLARDHQRLLNRLGLSFTVRRKEHKQRTKRQGETYVSWQLSADNQDTAAKFLQVVGTRIRHEKKTRATGLKRVSFDRVIKPDPVVSIEQDETGRCRCLTVDEDSSFSFEGVAVHNSRMLMVAAPAWAWERWPGLKFFCLSGNPSNVTRDAGFCRDLIQSDWYQNLFKPDWELRDDQNAVTRYTNTKGGERCSKGITAKVTGDRGDIILLDDPNDVKEADSDAIRNGINSDWDSSIYNRVNHYGAAVRIIIQQRVHEDDFSGHVLSKGNWVHVKLPLEYEVKNPCECHSCKSGILGDYDIRTEEGEVLHPERFTPEVIEDLKITLGEEGYAGQCQQNPDPASGGKFKWVYWRFWKPDGGPDIAARPERCYKGPARVLPEEFNDIIMTTDCAFKGKAKHDRVATFVVARLGADRFVIGRDCDNMDFGETKDSIRALAKAHPRAGAKLVEGKANGDAVVDDLSREITGMISVDPKGGKEARAAVLKPVVQAGNYYLPDGAPWLDDFCAEFARFPRGKNDDQIDAISQGEVYLQDEPEDDVYVPGTLFTR